MMSRLSGKDWTGNKNNMTQAEWDRVKQNMKEYLI